MFRRKPKPVAFGAGSLSLSVRRDPITEELSQRLGEVEKAVAEIQARERENAEAMRKELSNILTGKA